MILRIERYSDHEWHPAAWDDDPYVEVRAVKGKPGWYEAVAYLRPHFQLETLATSMRLVAELPKPRG